MQGPENAQRENAGPQKRDRKLEDKLPKAATLSLALKRILVAEMLYILLEKLSIVLPNAIILSTYVH